MTSLSLRNHCLTSCVRSTFLIVLFLAAPVAVADDDATRARDREEYELMRLFVETYQQVESNYVKDVDRRELMEAAIKGMLSHLDQYSSYIPPRNVRRLNQMVEQEFGGIGITVNIRNGRLVVVSPLPGTPAYRGGIRAGDIIVSVDGESTEKTTLDEAVQKLQGPVGRPVKVSVLHPGQEDPVEIPLIRQLIKAPTVRGDRYDEQGNWLYSLPDRENIGYVRLSNFSKYSADEVREAVTGLVEQNISGLILDLRFNPGGLLESAIEISDMFISEGNIVSVRGRNVAEKSWDAKKRGTFPEFPMAILVNRYSASASEVLSACLQDNKRAVIIGERTWGKGSVQNVIRMESGASALKLTTASYHRPSGVNIHRFKGMKPSDEWGVTPDEGFLLQYTPQQWVAWDRDRSARDVLRSEGAESPGPEGDSGDAFADTQLAAAVNYIEEQNDPNRSTGDSSSEDAPGGTTE